jgi:hypothetical protein
VQTQDLEQRLDSGPARSGDNIMFIREFLGNIKQDKEELPFDIEDDLAVYIRNDPMFYRKHYYPTVLKMQSAHKNNKSLDAVSLWAPVVKRAVIPYMTKFKIDKNPNDVIDDNIIKSIASKIYSEEVNNIKSGSYK